MFALGAFILWFGWMGFNGGSANRDFSDLAKILLNTNLGAAAGMLGAMLSMFILRTPVLMTRTVNGALGGLVAITAGCKTMDPMHAVFAGAIAGLLIAWGEMLLEQFRIDDAVGAIPVHGVCGVWGTIAAGLFYAGDTFNADRVMTQLIGAFAAMLWALPISYGSLQGARQIRRLARQRRRTSSAGSTTPSTTEWATASSWRVQANKARKGSTTPVTLHVREPSNTIAAPSIPRCPASAAIACCSSERSASGKPTSPRTPSFASRSTSMG